jgi:glycosyltransferase involved in cell wall biosynthesis
MMKPKCAQHCLLRDGSRDPSTSERTEGLAHAEGSMLAAPRELKLLSIVVAFYNEDQSTRLFFSEIEKVIGSLACETELVCVNDGSTDQTLDRLREEMRSNPRICIVDLARNFGKEAAITAGLVRATGDAVVVIDADLQDPPSTILTFIAKWHEGFDVVYGVRACRASDTFLKRWTAQCFYSLFNALADVRIPRDVSDFRLLDRRVVDALLSMPERNRFMKGMFAWVGFKQTSVEYVRAERSAGATGWTYFRLINLAIDGLTGFSLVPLRLAMMAGLLVSIFGFSYAAFLALRTVLLGIEVPGYASLMVVILSLGGVQLACLGIFGEYLGRLYTEAKCRPLYVVANTFSPEPRGNTQDDRTSASDENELTLEDLKARCRQVRTTALASPT